jgi:hypothetical protein
MNPRAGMYDAQIIATRPSAERGHEEFRFALDRRVAETL